MKRFRIISLFFWMLAGCVSTTDPGDQTLTNPLSAFGTHTNPLLPTRAPYY